MNKTELIKELRALTSAGMNNCREALEEASWDLSKAVDIVKVKGLNIADGRSGRAASEGVVTVVSRGDQLMAMLETNCETDFVARSPDFIKFSLYAALTLLDKIEGSEPFSVSDIEEKRQALVATTKENVVVRRWWGEQAFAPNARVFSYVHSNNKIGVLLTLLAPSPEALYAPDFTTLGENLAMQIAAMNPLAVSADRLSTEEMDRQTAIFQAQLTELKKPEATWPKIMEGKMRKWHQEVCLLEQEAVWLSKTSIKQAVAHTGAALGGEVQVINFIRCQVGEGLDTKKDNLAEEVAKMI